MSGAVPLPVRRVLRVRGRGPGGPAGGEAPGLGPPGRGEVLAGGQHLGQGLGGGGHLQDQER